MLQPGADAATDLFDSQSPGVVFVEALTDAAAQQEAETGEVVVSVDAPPAANFEVIHAQFFFADAKLRFDRPASKGDSQQTTQRHSVFSDDAVRDEKLRFPGADAAGNNQRVTCARQLFAGLSPDRQMFDLPDFRPLVSILDVIVLPRLQIKL